MYYRRQTFFEYCLTLSHVSMRINGKEDDIHHVHEAHRVLFIPARRRHDSRTDVARAEDAKTCWAPGYRRVAFCRAGRFYHVVNIAEGPEEDVQEQDIDARIEQAINGEFERFSDPGMSQCTQQKVR